MNDDWGEDEDVLKKVESYKLKAKSEEATSLRPVVATTGRHRAEAG